MRAKLKKLVGSRIFRLFGILVFIAVCMGIGSIMAYIEHESDPTEKAVVYFRAFVQRDYDKMYDCLELDSTYYVNKEMYKQTMKNIRENMVIDSYEINEPETKNGMDTITIECEDSQTQTTQDFVVYVTSIRDKFQIVPDYYINIDNMMVNDFSVIIPKGDSLELNGEKITDDMAEVTDGENSLSYTFTHILNGQYKVSATNKYCAKNEDIKLTKADTKVDLTKKEYTSNDKYTKLITDSGEKIIDQFYKAARARKPSREKLMKCIPDDKKLKKQVKNLVKKSQDVVYWPEVENIDNYKVITMDMSELEHSIKYDSDKEKFIVVYNYSYKYVSETETELFSSYVERLSGKCTVSLTLTYGISEENIVLTDIKMTNKNKKDGD